MASDGCPTGGPELIQIKKGMMFLFLLNICYNILCTSINFLWLYSPKTQLNFGKLLTFYHSRDTLICRFVKKRISGVIRGREKVEVFEKETKLVIKGFMVYLSYLVY